MDKNIVAFLREDVKTVNVRFFSDVKIGENWEAVDRYTRQVAGKEYKYICTFPNVKMGDLAIVFVGERPALVEVQSVDEAFGVEPNEQREYKYIAAIVDISAYLKLQEQNSLLKQKLAESYRRNTQRSFREQFLGGMEANERQELLEVLTK